MNKEKIAKLKKKLKDNAPFIAVIGTLTVIAVYSAFSVMRTINNSSSEEGSFKLDEVLGETRDRLLNDVNFALLELTDDEYLYVRRTLED
jgi:hypothetical protein